MKQLTAALNEIKSKLESMEFWNEDSIKVTTHRFLHIQNINRALYRLKVAINHERDLLLTEKQKESVCKEANTVIRHAIHFYNTQSKSFAVCKLLVCTKSETVNKSDNNIVYHVSSGTPKNVYYIYGWDYDNNVIIQLVPLPLSNKPNIVEILHHTRCGIQSWNYHDSLLYVTTDVDGDLKPVYTVTVNQPLIGFDFKADLLKDL